MSQPRLIDGLQFARGAEVLEGMLEASQLPRLREMHCIVEALRYTLRGKTDAQGRCWLHLSGACTLILQCQRCLEPFRHSLAVDAELLLSKTLQEIAAADDELDRVLAGKEMDVCRLIEDEVLLSLPMVPRHEACGGNAFEGKADRQSPFAGLAKLKRGQ